MSTDERKMIAFALAREAMAEASRVHSEETEAAFALMDITSDLSQRWYDGGV